MRDPEYIDVPSKHLKLVGFEANTGREVYCLKREPEEHLLRLLDAFGYELRQGIKLADGQLVDGWVIV